ncbi:MAG: hypothetical protein ACRED5_15645 [Propylenella sp.]
MLSRPVASANPIGRSAPLFDRLPERLVLEGFRRWIAGYASGDLTHWEEAWNLYAASLGPRAARGVVDGLARFVRSVRDWSVCPIACFPGGCRHICRQECFALAMVSASQNQDLDCLAAAMRHLLDPEGHEEAMLPALAYAEAMKERDLLLMPVPKAVIEEIAGRPPRERLH